MPIFPNPLRWYEVLLIKLLVRSPRIDQIHVVQLIRPDGNDPSKKEVISQLERLYQSPDAPR
jgi:hypothetical protein